MSNASIDDHIINLVAAVARLEASQRATERKQDDIIGILEELTETINQQQEEIDMLASVLGRWKAVGGVLLIVGAIGAWFVDKAIDIFLK